MKSRITDGEGTLDMIRQPRSHHTEVIHFAIAGFSFRGMDDPVDPLDPSRVPELLGRTVPVAANAPQPFGLQNGAANRLKQIKVALRRDAALPHHAVAVDRAHVDAAFGHGGDPPHAEASGGMQVLHGSHRCRH